MLSNTIRTAITQRNKIHTAKRTAVTVLKLADLFVDETLTKNKKLEISSSTLTKSNHVNARPLNGEIMRITKSPESWSSANNTIITDIETICKETSVDAALRAERIFRAYVYAYIKMNQQTPTLNITNDGNFLACNHFELVFSTLMKTGNLQRAQNFLEWMDNLYQAKLYPLLPSAPCFQALISTYLKGDYDPSKGKHLFLRLLDLSRTNSLAIGSNMLTQCANNIIYTYSKQGKSRKAFDFLVFLEQAEGIQIDSTSFNTVISGYIGSEEPEKCLQLLNMMEEMFERGHPTVKPTTVSYNSVMQCMIERNNNDNAINCVEEIFSRMLKVQRTNTDVKPDSRTYNILMNAHAAVGGIDAAIKIEKLLQHMETNYQAGDVKIKPDTVTFNTVIKSWASVGDTTAATNAEAILATMEELSKSGDLGAAPDHISYNNCIHAWSMCGNAESAENILKRMKYPNTISFNSVLSAWVKSDSNNAVDRMLALLGFMESESKGGNENIAPDEITHYQCIRALLQNQNDPRAILTANDHLKQIEHISRSKSRRPSLRHYGSLINACSKSKSSGVASMADNILWRMNKNCDYNEPKLVVRNFNMAIQTWLKSNKQEAPEKAKKILDRLIEIHRNENSEVIPDSYSFNTVIYTAARQKGNSKERTEALKIATLTFHLLREFRKGVDQSEFPQPDSYSFDALLKCAINLIPKSEKSRRTTIFAIFKNCCVAGCVDGIILAQLERKVPELCEDLFGKYIKRSKRKFVNVHDLPSEWSRRIPK